MKVIGLTGQSGAGKGCVADVLSEHGIPHIDCDAVYHDILVPPSECLDALVSEFGKKILAPDGELDRKALGKLVFTGSWHKKRLQKLNTITHGFVLERCREIIKGYENDGIKAVTVDAPTLFESGFDRECDIILVVTAPKEARAERITERDGITTDAALERISAQNDEKFYTEKADFVICNDSDLCALRKKTEDFISEFIKES